MKMYNKSEIMKRAWEIFHKAIEMFKKSVVTFSDCLREAWAEAKGFGMKGSEKQVAWATDIQKRVVGILADVINETKNDACYATSAVAQKNVAMFEKLVAAAKTCNSASAMINCYSDVKDLRGIVSAYKVHYCNTPAEKALLCK